MDMLFCSILIVAAGMRNARSHMVHAKVGFFFHTLVLMTDTDVTVTFDSANRLRVLAEDAYIHSADLRDTSIEFSKSRNSSEMAVSKLCRCRIFPVQRSHRSSSGRACRTGRANRRSSVRGSLALYLPVCATRMRVIGARTMAAMERDEGRERK